MTIDRQTPVGEIAARHPMATRVFERHGIDFCCGGGRALAEACERKGADVSVVIGEIEKELAGPAKDTVRWDQAPLMDLVDHIVVTYHRPLDEELPRLEKMAAKVLKVHGEKRPEMLSGVFETVHALKDELESHMHKEEEILFPLIREGHGAMALDAIDEMEHEHVAAGEGLAKLRELTSGYTVPEEACNTWTALWHGLSDLERALHAHIHLENNILFPRTRSESPM